MEDPLANPEEILYSDESSFVLDGKRRAGYAVVSHFETIEAKPLLPGTSAQLAEFIALTQALELRKGKRIDIYTVSKYAFLVLRAHAAVWKEISPCLQNLAAISALIEDALKLSFGGQINYFYQPPSETTPKWERPFMDV